MPIIAQNAILDQYTPLFCIKNPTDGQIFVYDSVSKTWRNESVDFTTVEGEDVEITSIKVYTNVGDGVTITYTIPWEADNKQSLEITLNGVRQQIDAYEIESNVPGETDVIFSEPPDNLDDIEIIGFITTNPDVLRTHQADGDGVTTSFRVPWLVPSESSIFIYFDGIKQQVGSYTTTKESSSTIVSFGTAPGDGILIEFTGVAGSVSFTDLDTIVDGFNLGSEEEIFRYTTRSDNTQILNFKTLEGRNGIITSDMGSNILFELDPSFVDNNGNYRSTSTDYSMQDDDAIIGVDTTGNTVTINLADATNFSPGKKVIIKDEGGVSPANNITILPVSGQPIDGSTSMIIDTSFGSLSLYSNGSQWFTF